MRGRVRGRGRGGRGRGAVAGDFFDIFFYFLQSIFKFFRFFLFFFCRIGRGVPANLNAIVAGGPVQPKPKPSNICLTFDLSFLLYCLHSLNHNNNDNDNNNFIVPIKEKPKPLEHPQKAVIFNIYIFFE